MKYLHSNRKNNLLVVGAILVIGLGCYYFFLAKKAKPATADSPNVILISVDTLGAEYLGAYGYSRDTSPNIDAFAKKNILFENAYTPFPCTFPSYSSLFSGVYPASHGALTLRANGQLDKKFTTLAQSFKEIDYKTAGFISNRMINNKDSGLGRGFDLYDEIDKKDVRANRNNTYGINGDNMAFQRGERTTEQASEWLKSNSKSQFFLFVQYVDPHHPYGQAEPFTNKFVSGDSNNPLARADLQQEAINSNYASQEDTSYLEARYAEDVAYVDYYIGELLKQIEVQGLDKNSIIMITADHGESFDHDYLGHCFRLYNSNVKVPLIYHDPRTEQEKGMRVEDNVSLVDIYPTLASRLKMKENRNDFDGKDFGPLLRGQKLEERNILLMSSPSWADVPLANTDETLDISKEKRARFLGQLYGLISGEKKIIYNQNSGKKEVYDFVADPNEKKDISSKVDPTIFESLLFLMNKYPLDSTRQKRNEAFYENLKGLGYL